MLRSDAALLLPGLASYRYAAWLTRPSGMPGLAPAQHVPVSETVMRDSTATGLPTRSKAPDLVPGKLLTGARHAAWTHWCSTSRPGAQAVPRTTRPEHWNNPDSSSDSHARAGAFHRDGAWVARAGGAWGAISGASSHTPVLHAGQPLPGVHRGAAGVHPVNSRAAGWQRQDLCAGQVAAGGRQCRCMRTQPCCARAPPPPPLPSLSGPSPISLAHPSNGSCASSVASLPECSALPGRSCRCATPPGRSCRCATPLAPPPLNPLAAQAPA
jgi:hypothetical protein